MSEPSRSAPARSIFGFGAWPLWIMGLLLGAYVVGLTFRGHDDFSPVVDGWLGSSTQWVPAAVCWMVAVRTRFRRAPVVLASVALTSYAIANHYYLVSQAGATALPFPSPADFGYLLFFPLMVAALWAFMHRQLRELSWPVLLDSAAGALGAAAVLAVLLSPVLDSAGAGPLSLPTVVAVAYPLFDVVLVAVVVGIAATRGLRFGYRWTLLALGLLVLAASDVTYALRLSTGDYAVGTPLDAGWAIGLTLVAVWVDGAERSPAPAAPTETRSRTLAAPAAATVAGLGVLILSSQAHITTLAVTLAGLTIVFAALRTHLAFRELVKMADLRRLSLTDDLTTLPNRRALYAEMPRRLTAAEGGRSALLLLDLDRFKEVNDSLGHDIGDRLLTQVGERFSQQLRPSDLLARLGGDEFAILLDNAGQGEAVAFASKLHASLAEPFILSGIAVQTDVSIGIALHPDQGDDLTVLLRRADMAMYKAKAARTGHHVFLSTDDRHGGDRLRTLEELRTAVTDNQLVLHFQPKIDLDTEEVHGVEALIRWNHPSRGLLYPDSFLEMVEETGLMREMTDLVLRQALDQAVNWRARDLTVAVNLSASSLVDADLPERIVAMIEERGLETSALALEITEDFLMADRDRARAILTRLRDAGVVIAIDDFGTGYSSLAYLRDLPIDELKLDRSFVMTMAGDPRAAALVASTIHLAHSLGMRMVAEGVEDAATYEQLIAFGCDHAQGYYLSRPLPAADLDRWLAERLARTMALPAVSGSGPSV